MHVCMCVCLFVHVCVCVCVHFSLIIKTNFYFTGEADILYHRNSNKGGYIMRVGAHCSLYPPPPYTIHPPPTDLILRESVNCISEVPDTRNSAN